MCFRSKKKTPAAPSKEKQTEDSDTCQCPIESPPEHLLQVNYQKKIFTVQKCHPKVVSTYFQKSGDFLTVFCFGFSRKNLAWGQKCDIFVKGNVETSATLNDLIIFRGHMTLNQTLTSSSREDTKGQKVANLSCQVALPIAEISCPQNPTRSRKNYLFWCAYASTILVIIESSDVEWFWNPDMSSINFIRNIKLDWLVGIGHVLWLCRNFLVSKVPNFVKSILCWQLYKFK